MSCDLGANLLARLSTTENSLRKAEADLSETVSVCSEIESSINTLLESIDLTKRCLKESVEKKVYLEEIVSDGLTSILGEKFEFKLEATLEGGSVKNLKPLMRVGDGKFRDPQEFGGAAQAITSLLLRMAALLLTPGAPRFICIDEPIPQLNVVYWDKFLDLIEDWCDQTGLQVLMITHSDPGGKVYIVNKADGISRAKEASQEEWVEFKRRYKGD